MNISNIVLCIRTKKRIIRKSYHMIDFLGLICLIDDKIVSIVCKYVSKNEILSSFSFILNSFHESHKQCQEIDKNAHVNRCSRRFWIVERNMQIQWVTTKLILLASMFHFDAKLTKKERITGFIVGYCVAIANRRKMVGEWTAWFNEQVVNEPLTAFLVTPQTTITIRRTQTSIFGFYCLVIQFTTSSLRMTCSTLFSELFLS
jgi:hypothetical protein